MTMEEAIKTAIDYETRIRDIYRDAAEVVSDPVGKRTLQMLRDDEQHHVEYLMDRLELWEKTGKLSYKKLESTIPSVDTIQRGMEKIRAHMSLKARRGEIEILSKALKAEVGTIVSNPYTERVKMIVVESGKDSSNTWITEERNLFDDYVAAFGAKPPMISGIAIMTDSDNTKESATTFYGDILFRKK